MSDNEHRPVQTLPSAFRAYRPSVDLRGRLCDPSSSCTILRNPPRQKRPRRSSCGAYRVLWSHVRTVLPHTEQITLSIRILTRFLGPSALGETVRATL